MEPPVILIGQYDSSFVRRVAIALTLYGVPFEHRPWSIFGDVDKIRPLNPLIRVPALVLDDGTALVETLAIGCHAVDRAAPQPGETVLVIGAGPIGLSAIEFVKVSGARCLVMDMNADRLAFCRDVMKVDGITEKVAENIYAFFH